MGLDVEFARLLLDTRARGVSFARCLTLGRQNYFLSGSETRSLLRRYKVDSSQHPDLFSNELLRYAEPFWKLLGAEIVDSMDASNFEGASIIHDLNVSVPESLEERYDVVLDGGTIEHVFNVPAAIANCMRMVRTGGRFILFTPANNYFGHGFYQFSPEFFYRVFSAPYGFQIERVLAVEYGPRRRWHEVSDPDEIKARVTLINSFQVLLWVQARKVSRFTGFNPVPKQSDYVSMWEAHGENPQKGPPMPPAWASPELTRLRHKFLETFPKLGRMIESMTMSPLNPRHALRNRLSFRRVRK